MRQRRKDNSLNGDRLPLFRQGGATVGLTTKPSVCRIRGASYLRGSFAEVIREDLVRRMNRGGGSRPGVEGPRITQSAGSMGWDLKFSFIILEVRWFSKGP